MAIPTIPGNVVPHRSDQENWLKAEVARLCQLDHQRFPGSQPVSFAERDLSQLERQDYWVCEKSDGIRVLCFVNTTNSPQGEAQNSYLIDRHNEYRQLDGLFFPHHENPTKAMRNTIVDGELVIDVDPRTGAETLRFLAFDCLVANDQNVMLRPLDKRYGRLKEFFHKPYERMMRDHPHMAASRPFDVRVKGMSLSYCVEDVFNLIPHLQHGNDGLIYTAVAAPYTPGTDPNIIKWKPPSENSVDFKLVLRFPPSQKQPSKPDLYAKPMFLLNVWNGGSSYDLYDELYVSDAQWEEWKQSGEQYDDRIIEVHWDSDKSHWLFMRFRDDKPNGNHRSVVDKIIQSISEGVEKDKLLARSNTIRIAWKTRHGQPAGAGPISAHPHVNAPQPQINQRPVPPPEFLYGPLQVSRYSKVSGPAIVAGMKR